MTRSQVHFLAVHAAQRQQLDRLLSIKPHKNKRGSTCRVHNDHAVGVYASVHTQQCRCLFIQEQCSLCWGAIAAPAKRCSHLSASLSTRVRILRLLIDDCFAISGCVNKCARHHLKVAMDHCPIETEYYSYAEQWRNPGSSGASHTLIAALQESTEWHVTTTSASR